jgi:hypothetical protein
MTLTLVGDQTGTTSQVTVTVGQAGTTTVTASNVSTSYGAATPIPVTVSGGGAPPSGTVHLMSGATEITSGTVVAGGIVTLTVPGKLFHPGQVTLKVVYDGDATHSGSETTLTLTTLKATSTTVGTDGSAVYGQAGSVTVSVTAPNGVVPTGTVTLKDGATTVGVATTLSGGTATVAVPATSLAVGTHTLTASYSGDGDVQASSDDVTFTVDKAASTMTVKVKPKQPRAGKQFELRISVEAPDGVAVTGTVVVKVNGEKYTAAVKNGKATVKLKLGKGSYKANLTYLGTTQLASSTAKVKFTVR